MSYEMNAPVVASLDRLFTEPPQPYPDCRICAALHGEWKRLSNPKDPEFDRSRAVDVAIEIRQHPQHKART